VRELVIMLRDVTAVLSILTHDLVINPSTTGATSQLFEQIISVDWSS